MGHKARWLLEAWVSVSWVEQVIYIWFRQKGIRNASHGHDWKQKHEHSYGICCSGFSSSRSIRMICPTVSGFTGTKGGFSGLWCTNRRLLRTWSRGWHTCVCWLCLFADESCRPDEVPFMWPHSVSYLRKLPTLGKNRAAFCIISTNILGHQMCNFWWQERHRLCYVGNAADYLAPSGWSWLSVGSLRDWVNPCNHLSITRSLAQYLSSKCARSASCVSPATGLAVTHFLSLCPCLHNVYHQFRVRTGSRSELAVTQRASLGCQKEVSHTSGCQAPALCQTEI